MIGSMSKHYEPSKSERHWYRVWMEKGYFHADALSSRPPYSIVIPPPNVTGSLHMGHALNNTIQDILIRYRRMQGFEALWMPGTDHAGIATQNVVEKELAGQGIERNSLGREDFIKRVWAWKEKYGGVILEQLQRLGASCDWERERFTMDEGLSRAVREVFVRLYREGYIYQGDYITNWCPRCHTALSDLEVEYHDRKGHLYHLRYPAVDGSGDVVVATTRPETMLGDTAVAVHPDDGRYTHLRGHSFRLPLTNREIPLITDAYCNMEFGTGAVKVTPAHDPNDFEIGERHDLPKITVISLDGTMTHEAGENYEGLDRYLCRERVVADLKEQGCLEAVEDYDYSVGQCYRCQTVIEPIISRQWFIRMKDLARPGIEAVEDGRIEIYPETWKKTYYEWMNNIRDWCISRQIWWGHRIPVWTCPGCDEMIVDVEEPESCPTCATKELHQEEDVLDTWFSSALWPFSTMGWPEENDTLKRFYPTSCLVTGFDILFFWVARMIMMGMKFMGDVPFRHVYIHALVRDADGQKMSKSRGNVIDPLVMIDRYGADAFRFTLAAFAAMGRDVKLAEDRIEGYRHFVNKIWNASKLVLQYAGEVSGEEMANPDAPADLPNRWILSRLSRVVDSVRDAFDSYRFNEAAGALYHFFWHEFCDWYLELAKPSLYGDQGKGPLKETSVTAARVLETSLRLLHPIMPFLSEEIWQRLPVEGESIMFAPFPEADRVFQDADAEEVMATVIEYITAFRNLRTEMGIKPSERVPGTVLSQEAGVAEVLRNHQPDILRLARLESLSFDREGAKPDGVATAVVKGQVLFIRPGRDIDVEAERSRLLRELEKVTDELMKVDGKLSNTQFLEKAPAEVVEKNRDIQAELSILREKLEANLESLGE
ncbi:MAG: valine--tRNA ligase [bacterium]|nr:MAG: valine--tRNA ligase [bacterium]